MILPRADSIKMDGFVAFQGHFRVKIAKTSEIGIYQFQIFVYYRVHKKTAGGCPVPAVLFFFNVSA